MNTIPLNASFVGSNTVLNDGMHPNTLVIRVSSLLPEGDIPMHANGKPARFVLTFSVSPNDNPEQHAPWALCTLDAADKLQVCETSQGWQRTRIQVEPFAAWEFTPPASEGDPVLAAGEHVQIEISEICCRLPSGPTTLALHLQHHNKDDSSKGTYETVARFLLTAEKSPLIYRDVYRDKQFQSRTNLGIGTTIGNTEKQIRLAIGAESTGLHDPAPGQLALWTSRAERLRIDDQGRVGIGTPTPGARLEIAQGSGLAIKVEPDPNQVVYIGTSPLNALEFNSSDGQALNSTAHLNFNIDTNQTDKNRHVSFQARSTTLMRIHQAGNVGIPLPDKKTRLTITGKTANADEAGLTVTNSDGRSLLFVRNDGNIGVGTATPGATLEIKGTTADANQASLNVTNSGGKSLLFVRNDGNIGVGMESTDPFEATFEIKGASEDTHKADLSVRKTDGLAIRVGPSSGNSVYIGRPDAGKEKKDDYYVGQNALEYDFAWGQAINSTANVQINIDSNDADDSRHFTVAKNSAGIGSAPDSKGTALFTVRESGNVGIGTPKPQARLHVHTDVPDAVRTLSVEAYPTPAAIFTGCLNDSKAKKLLKDLPIYSFMFGVEAQTGNYNALLFFWKDGNGEIHKGYFSP